MADVRCSKNVLARWSAVLAIPLGLASVAGCGDGSGGVAKDPASTGSAPTTSAAAAMPACGDVWKAGGTIPGGYRGCTEGGKVVAAKRTPCASGQVLVTFADKFYGAIGGPVNAVPAGLSSSSKYHSAVRACD
jgi:hypothetical protein